MIGFPRTLTVLIALLATMGLLALAGCGGDDDDTSTDPPTSEATQGDEAPDTTEGAVPDNLDELAEATVDALIAQNDGEQFRQICDSFDEIGTEAAFELFKQGTGGTGAIVTEAAFEAIEARC